jgi:hypothetical protein
VLRSLTASLTGLVAALLLPLAVLSVWTHDVVSDTDSYVDTVTPLADDDVVKAAAVQELQREALELVATGGTQPPPGAEQLVHLVVEQVVDGPLFRRAWAEANRAAHEQLVAVLEGRSGVVLDDGGRVTIELGTVFSSIAQSLATQGLISADRAENVDASFAVMDAGRLADVRRGYDALETLRLWLPVAWLVAAGLTLLLARRRLAALAKLAAATLVALGLLALALVFARDTLTANLPERDVAQAVWDVVVAGLWRAIEVFAAGAVVVALVAAVLAAVVGRAHSPSGQHPDGEQQLG